MFNLYVNNNITTSFTTYQMLRQCQSIHKKYNTLFYIFSNAGGDGYREGSLTKRFVHQTVRVLIILSSHLKWRNYEFTADGGGLAPNGACAAMNANAIYSFYRRNYIVLMNSIYYVSSPTCIESTITQTPAPDTPIGCSEQFVFTSVFRKHDGTVFRKISARVFFSRERFFTNSNNYIRDAQTPRVGHTRSTGVVRFFS